MPTADTFIAFDFNLRKLETLGVYDDKRSAHIAVFNRLRKYWPDIQARLFVEEWDSTQSKLVKCWTFKIWRAIKNAANAERMLRNNKAKVVYKQDGLWMVVIPERS